jgi:sialidase-1
MAQDRSIEQRALFVSGEGGYHTYRIPALCVATTGTLLAFCEGRKEGRGDAGEIDVLLRRSTDGGRTWGEPRVVVSAPGVTSGNPCPVVDRTTGVIWLPFCRNLADGDEELITRGKASRTVWLTHSEDDGVSWAAPVEITASVKRPEWTWYATGPGHGIQLADGRLLIPCDHMVGVHLDRRRDPYHSHVIYSDDHGATWQIGGIVDDGTNECALAELSDGAVYINCRSYRNERRRAVAWSRDGGDHWSAFTHDAALVEPVCQASLVAVPRMGDAACVLFANPASTESRTAMTVRASVDGCRTWSQGLLLHAGPSAYSDLAVTHDGTVCCLYERGDADPYAMLMLACFDVAEVTARP